MAIYNCKKCKREFISFQVESPAEEAALCPDCCAKEIMSEGTGHFCEFDMEREHKSAREEKNAYK
jgi:DNA-directed RNA polymerase subunit RPC12/RpoP